MERLTEWNGGQTRHAYYPRCFKYPCYGNGCKIKDCTLEIALCERLAAYEDTGLEPEAVETVKLALAAKHMVDLETLNNTPISRLIELAEADKDGRVVVLPCKVGDVMYKLFREYTECTSYQVRKDNYCCEGCMVPCDSREVTVIRAIQPNSLPEVVRYIEDIGKTVFLSREEAEKALQEMEGKKDG